MVSWVVRFLSILLASFAVLMSGCAPSGSDGGGTSGSSTSSKPGATGTGTLKGDLDVVAFLGGYDIDFYVQAGKEFQEKNPGLTVKVDGDPHIWEKIRPRMVSGDTPDIMFPGWDMDQWGLVQDGQLMELDAALDSPAHDGKTKWRDTFDPNVLKLSLIHI